MGRIVVVSVTQGDGGGAEAVLAHLLSGWQGPDEIVVLSPRNSQVESIAQEQGIPLVVLPTRTDSVHGNNLAMLRAKSALVGVSLVHAWTARCFDSARLLGYCLGVPVMGTQHDHPQSAFHSISRRYLMRWSANRIEGVVCVSHALASACKDSGYQAPLTVIHNGLLDVNELWRCRNRPGRLRIGFLGMNAPLKGFYQIREWIVQMLDKSIEWHLYGNVHKSLQSDVLAIQDRYPDCVHLHGRQPTETIFAQIDLLVHASTEFDAFPTVLLEAARAGLPVVASNLGGSVEIVVHERTGFLFAPTLPEEGLGWLRLLADQPTMCSSIGQAARQRFIEKFRVAQMVENYANIWKQAIGS